MLSVEATLTYDSSPQEVRDARLASVPLSIRNRSSLALLIFMALLFRTRSSWPRQPRACVNGARYDIISLLGRSVTLVTFHSVDASEIDCCLGMGPVVALSRLRHSVECPLCFSKISHKYVNLHGMSERKSAGARDRLEIVESDARLLLKRRPTNRWPSSPLGVCRELNTSGPLLLIAWL